MFRLLLMNVLFLLAALAHNSGADSNRVLSDIPFGPAESHIRLSGVQPNRLWLNVSIPNVHYATDDEIWGSEFPIDTGMFSKKEQLTNLATGQGSTRSNTRSTNTRSNTRSLPQQEAHSLCETQRNLLEKYVTMSDKYREPHDEVLHDNYMLPATYADENGDEANEQFGDTEGHENRGSTPLQISGNEIILGARGSYSPHTSNITTLQQGELSILNFDECGPQQTVTDFRHIHELHEFTSAASHIGLTLLHGICLRNTLWISDRPERTVHVMQLELEERDQKLNDLWIHDDMDYDEENNYRINVMNYFDIRNCLNRRLRNCYRRRNRHESKLMILTTKKMLTCRECREACQRMENQHSLAVQVYECGDLTVREGYRMVGLSVIVY